MRKANRQLRLEREILARGAAWFAQQTAVSSTRSWRPRMDGTLRAAQSQPDVPFSAPTFVHYQGRRTAGRKVPARRKSMNATDTAAAALAARVRRKAPSKTPSDTLRRRLLALIRLDAACTIRGYCHTVDQLKRMINCEIQCCRSMACHARPIPRSATIANAPCPRLLTYVKNSSHSALELGKQIERTGVRLPTWEP